MDFWKSVACLFVMVFCLSCPTYAQRLPKTWEAGMKLELTIVSATKPSEPNRNQARYGVRPVSEPYTIKYIIMEEEAVMTSTRGRGETIRKKLSPEQFAALIALLHNHNFDEIQTLHTGYNYEKPARSVVLQWSHSKIEVTDGDAMQVSPTDLYDFDGIVSGIDSIFMGLMGAEAR
jgi:hypothetical protein